MHTTTTTSAQLADAIRAADLAGGIASYDTFTTTYFYSYTADSGTLILGTVTFGDRFFVAYVSEPTLDEAIDYLGTATDDEAGTRFYATADEAVAAFAAARDEHRLTCRCGAVMVAVDPNKRFPAPGFLVYAHPAMPATEVSVGTTQGMPGIGHTSEIFVPVTTEAREQHAADLASGTWV